MNNPTRVAATLVFAAGAVVTQTGLASAAPPPCGGWATAAAHSDAAPVAEFDRLCNIESPTFKQAWPVKWG